MAHIGSYMEEYITGWLTHIPREQYIKRNSYLTKITAFFVIIVLRKNSGFGDTLKQIIDN